VIGLICFSRDRPLQLHGYLRSLFDNLDEPALVEAQVLYRAAPEYEAAYAEVAAELPAVRFVRQTDFYSDLRAMLGAHEHTSFGCDDVVFTGRFEPRAIVRALAGEDVFAFSLRLGLNLSRSMFSGAMAPPPDLEPRGGILHWDLRRAHAFGDWGYSFELNGTVYPTAIVRQLVDELRPATPNALEAGGGGRWSGKTARHVMCAWPESRLVVPTVNVVQTDFANGICGRVSLSPRFLLECWQSGLRLDVERFRGRRYDCIHVPDFFLRRDSSAL
jgi:hypothetical protein